MGMKGIDEEFALLQTVRAHLCVKWKIFTCRRTRSCRSFSCKAS